MGSFGDFLFFAVCFGYVAYRAYIFFCCPEIYEAEQRRKHEKEMAQIEARKARYGGIAGGLLGGVTKVVLDAVIKRRPHH